MLLRLRLVLAGDEWELDAIFWRVGARALAAQVARKRARPISCVSAIRSSDPSWPPLL